ncbi:MAG: thymidine phosphorylase family protein [Deltaproteobacteria bacterium]|nr:thymidine phosphorylase family protein [Deltaproteobacteria bacterium]MBI3388911.1 thymidine phosphorylase family protein [Deltaproteobacteria bacterium]
MFRLKHLQIDTLSEHVVFIHEAAVRAGNLGLQPLDRVHVVGDDPAGGPPREVTGILNFCRDALVAHDEIGLSDVTFRDLGLPDGAAVRATIAPAPRSVDFVRRKLRGKRLDRAAFDAILTDVVQHRYSKVELSMFVLACALQTLDLSETVDLTRAMIAAGTTLDFGPGPIVDKHCIGGVPGHRTTMVVVPILAALGLTVPKTSSRAITSPAGTADTMGVLAEVALSPARIHQVVEQAGACITWGGALDLAPADDILITVERPMEIDTEVQMVASILSKKKTAGATHALIDIPVGRTAKIRSMPAAERLEELFRAVAKEINLRLEVVITEAHGPIGWGIGPRLEALDVLAVLRRTPGAPTDLREKSLYLAARILEMVGSVPPAGGYRAAQQALDSGAAEQALDRIVAAQGAREFPPEAPYRHTVTAAGDGHIRAIDCWEIARVAKRAGAPAHAAAGVRLLRTVGDVVATGEPLFEIHAQSMAQLDFGRTYAAAHPDIFCFGF